MTNGWIDIKNTDMMLIMGGNPAENHPCGFKWAVEAKRNRNAKMIVSIRASRAPPRTPTSSVRFAPAADIAFLGGVISYAIENNRIAKEYLVNYTNAAFIVKDGFQAAGRRVVSGFDPSDQDLRQDHLELRRGRRSAGKRSQGRTCARSKPLNRRRRTAATRQTGQGAQFR
jgi:anaerobic selenocysteine-containing dehydrogenase